MKLVAFGKTDVGKSRGHNEDFMLKDHELGLYGVCDGMGGHASGEVASETAARALDSFVREHIDVVRGYDGTPEALDRARDMLREAVEYANAKVREAPSEGKGRPGMGTTCVCLLLLGNKGIMGHVGDSRLYMHRDGKVYQLSEDHTYVNDAIRHGLMTPEQAAASPYAHAVTRGLGMGEMVCVDTLAFDVSPGDSFLLCSDGLYEYFENNREIAQFLGDDDTEQLPDRLVGMANERGGKDNITAVVIKSRIDANTDRMAIHRGTQISTNLKTLQFIGLFQELSPKELVRVLNAFHDAEFDAGQTIIGEGETSENLYVIVEGECEVARRGEEITTLLAGSHFGEMALLNRRPRTATVKAKTPVRLLALSRHDFNRVIRQDNGLAAKLLWKLAQSLSLRLDDLYLMRETEAEMSRKTQRLQILSPFGE
jgi:serine/threonine protein phosphatase PrpC